MKHLSAFFVLTTFSVAVNMGCNRQNHDPDTVATSATATGGGQAIDDFNEARAKWLPKTEKEKSDLYQLAAKEGISSCLEKLYPKDTAVGMARVLERKAELDRGDGPAALCEGYVMAEEIKGRGY
jgi:hypothetical protein